MKLSDAQRKKVQEDELQILIKFDEICRKFNLKYTLAAGTMIGAVRHKGFIPWDDDIDVYMLRNDFNKLRKIAPMELPENMFYQSHYTDPEYYYPFDKIRLDGTIFKETFLANHNINHGVFIDVFPIDSVSNNKCKSTIQFYHYRFYRLGLMTKYVNIEARSGKRKTLANILRVLYLPFNLDYLYKKCEIIAQQKESRYKNSKWVRNLNSVGSDGMKETYHHYAFTKLEFIEFEKNKFYISKDYDAMLRAIYGNYMKLPPKSEQVTRHDLAELKL
ncbi:MAG: phosphorylcholine transferase LicD [Lactobacillus crispatus]